MQKEYKTSYGDNLSHTHALFFPFFCPPWWRKVNGCHREEEGPGGDAQTGCFISSNSSPPLPYIQPSWYSHSVGRNNVVLVMLRFFPALQRSHTSAGFPNPYIYIGLFFLFDQKNVLLYIDPPAKKKIKPQQIKTESCIKIYVQQVLQRWIISDK